jgi:hypothetical protein
MRAEAWATLLMVAAGMLLFAVICRGTMATSHEPDALVSGQTLALALVDLGPADPAVQRRLAMPSSAAIPLIGFSPSRASSTA